MSNILAQRWLLDRRTVLRGIGTAVALPLLDIMRPLRAAGPAPARPKRCVFVYIPNGVNVYDWQIAKAGPDYALRGPLRVLDRHRPDITPISGLHHPVALSQQHVCADTWLTAAPLSNGTSSRYKNSVSCDQLMAEAVGAATRFPSLELSIYPGVGQPLNTNTLSFSRDGVPLPAEDNPRVVFDRLFGAEPAGAKARLARRQGVLDAVLGDAKTFRQTLGADDRGRLDEYLHAVREVEVRTGRLDAWLTVPKPQVDGTPFQRNVTKTQAGEYYRTMYDLIALALRTDMTRVVTYMTGSETYGLAIPEIEITQTRHELSHHNGDPVVLAKLAKSDAFLAQQFAYFLDKLKAATEDGEPLLDRTAVLFGSGMSYGHSHGNANLPLVLAGGKAMGLKHGRHLDFNLPRLGAYKTGDDGNEIRHICHSPVDPDARMSNLLLTLLQKMGGRADRFADSLKPLAEVSA